MAAYRSTVSRKTPGDGKLEIPSSAADELRRSAVAITLRVGDRQDRTHVVAMPCTCRGEGERHVHFFLESALFKSLPVGAAVTIDVAGDDGAVIVAVD